MTLQSKSKIFSYSSEIGDLILNSSPNLVDIYINSGLDGRCFRAHRVVLAAASEILANILDTSCQFCGGEPDENTALTFAGVSGTTLENFLALCYTGVSLNIKDYRDESELKSFCSEFKLYSPESLVRISNPSTDFILGSVLSQDETPVGYNECDNLKTLLSGEVLKLAAVCPEIVEQHFDDLINADLDHLHEASENDVFFHTESKIKLETLQVEEDYNDFEIHNEVFEEPNFQDDEEEDNLPLKRTLRASKRLQDYDVESPLVKKSLTCESCDKVFRSKASFERHVQGCFVENKSIPTNKRRRTRNGTKAKVDYEMEERDGRFFCLHNDCKGKDEQSFETKGEVGEHWNVEHSTEEDGNDIGEKPYVCVTCGSAFKAQFNLRIHVDLHHSDDQKYKCDECGKCFSRKSILNQHMLKHQISSDKISSENLLNPPKIEFFFSKDEEGRFLCLHPDCQAKTYAFTWKNGFQDHWLDKHASEEEKVYKCTYCNKGFASNGLRNKHIKFTHELKFTCSQCDKKFPTRHTLMSHTRMHTGEKPYVCHLCGADFRNRTNWRQHNEQYHADVKKHKCDECGKQFRLRATLKEHQIRHQLTKQFNVDFPLEIVENEEGKQAMYYVPKTDYPMREENGRFFCTHEDCNDKNQSFQWKNGLREHYMERHALDNEKHFGCNFCTKKFGTNALRNKHEKITHLLRFPCVHCDKKFGKRVTLVHHMRLHTGEKPFVCEICGTRFSQKTYLKQHNDLHHPKEEIKKEHKCDTCGKFFRLKGQLKHHIKTTHIEGRPYVCEECGKNYKDIGTLKRHKESHSGVRIACEPCNITFPSRANLRRHMRRKHEKKIVTLELVKPELLVSQ